MAREADRGLAQADVERRSSLNLLAAAAASAGFEAEVGRSGLVLRRHGRISRLPWPPVPAVRKSEIPGLLEGSGQLRPVATRVLKRGGSAPWMPCCIKPDEASLGEGFREIHDLAQWRRATGAVDPRRPFVVQPLLKGIELRVTACSDGHFAAARLAERRGSLSRWTDETDRAATEWISELLSIVERLGAPGLGFDLMVAAGAPHLLDVNPGPSLALHLVTEPPRDLAPSFLSSWLRAAGRRRAPLTMKL